MGQDGRDLQPRLTRAGVTEREAEVLSAVAERLRNREIAERFHVSVRTVESHIASLMRKLDVADRADLVELGVGLRSARAEATVPTPLTTLVGRTNELSQLAQLLQTNRLVTLLGPAGVGKTRLALTLASDENLGLADGARLADLSPVQPDLVADTLARALGVVPGPGESLLVIMRELARTMRCLLVVDNCEHVIADIASIIADILSSGGELRVLTTSREPLGVPGEVTYPVTTLSIPTPEAAERADTAMEFDSVRLFVERAATASPGFTLTDAAAPAVAALAERLDGLPLAIELAASRVRAFAPAELVQHLDQRFDLLTGGARTAPNRHRTLRGAVDWSYDLLEPDERSLFERLGAFPADFDFEAAQAMCTDGDIGGAAAITLLPRLVDKSLVSAVGRGSRRYRLLETIRAYAGERLVASGLEPVARERHASHYLAVAERAAVELRTSNQRMWLDRLNTELPNLRAGLAHAINAGNVDACWRWFAALQRFCEQTGHRLEAQAWLEHATNLGEPPATPAAVVGLAAASSVLQPTDAQAAFEMAQRAVHLAAGLDRVTRGRAYRSLGMGSMWVQHDLQMPALMMALECFGDDNPWDKALTMQCLTQATGDLAEALQWGRSSVALFRQVGDQMYAANTLFLMAQRSMYASIADDEVYDWLAESRALAQAAGSDEDQAHAIVGFGQLSWLRGDRASGAAHMEEVLPTLRRLGDHRCVARALHMMGQYAHESGELTRAEELLRGSLESVLLAGQSYVLVGALESLADLYRQQSRPRAAAILLGVAHTARVAASVHMRPVAPSDEQLPKALREALGNTAFEEAVKEGGQLSPAQALAFVTEQGDGLLSERPAAPAQLR